MAKSQALLFCIVTLFSIANAAQPVASTLPGYDWQVALDVTYNLYWRADLNNSVMYLALEAQTTGWVGFGLAEPTSGSMQGSDIVTGYVDDINGSTYIIDRYATAKSTPPADTCQDWTLINGTQRNGWTTLHLKRAFDTADVLNDRKFTTGLVRVVFSYALTDVFTKHTFRQAGGVVFWGTGPPEGVDLPDVSGSYPLQFHNYTLSSNTSHYACQSFLLPDTTAHVINFEPMINQTNYVHHMLVHACDGASDFWKYYAQGASPCVSPAGNFVSGCYSVMMAWAVGGGSVSTPPVAGFRIGNGGRTYLLIEIHYNNPNRNVGVVDTSGVRLWYTTTLRQYDAGLLQIAQPFPSGIVPGASLNTTQEYSCPSFCTRNLPIPIRVFGSMLHMHSYGLSIYTHLTSPTRRLITNRIEYWDFGYQQNTYVDYTIFPGDQLNTHCYWNTASSSVDVPLGPDTTQEMCMDFLSYYPAITNFSYCGPVPPSRGPSTAYICGGNSGGINASYPQLDQWITGEAPAERIFGQLDSRAQCPANPTVTLPDVNACIQNPCHVNATCQDIVFGNNDKTGRVCTCNAGYIGNGETCDIDACHDYPCASAHAVCTDITGGPNSLFGRTCACENGYLGGGLGLICSGYPTVVTLLTDTDTANLVSYIPTSRNLLVKVSTVLVTSPLPITGTITFRRRPTLTANWTNLPPVNVVNGQAEYNIASNPNNWQGLVWIQAVYTPTDDHFLASQLILPSALFFYTWPLNGMYLVGSSKALVGRTVTYFSNNTSTWKSANSLTTFPITFHGWTPLNQTLAISCGASITLKDNITNRLDGVQYMGVVGVKSPYPNGKATVDSVVILLTTGSGQGQVIASFCPN